MLTDQKLQRICERALEGSDKVDDWAIDSALTLLDDHESLAIEFVHEALSEMSDKQALMALHDAAVGSGDTLTQVIRSYMSRMLLIALDDVPGESNPFDGYTEAKDRAWEKRNG